jgi:hypothetical protein
MLFSELSEGEEKNSTLLFLWAAFFRDVLSAQSQMGSMRLAGQSIGRPGAIAGRPQLPIVAYPEPSHRSSCSPAGPRSVLLQSQR